MGHRKDIYVDKLGLIPLPNGGGCQGYFAETYRSSETLQVEGSEGNDRSIFTTIYYLMAPELGGMNFLNSNKSDTVHYFHDGWPAKYVLVSPSEGKVKEYILGRDVTKGQGSTTTCSRRFPQSWKNLSQGRGICNVSR